MDVADEHQCEYRIAEFEAVLGHISSLDGRIRDSQGVVIPLEVLRGNIIEKLDKMVLLGTRKKWKYGLVWFKSVLERLAEVDQENEFEMIWAVGEESGVEELGFVCKIFSDLQIAGLVWDELASLDVVVKITAHYRLPFFVYSHLAEDVYCFSLPTHKLCNHYHFTSKPN
eukprot:TRINITY_DN14858_c0_g1_i1.p1 TRINITY_DN14858_c0_g1~~TRINITY_DN14858_c0_g1_i1.p1  ORF type:complete len:179 (-),score=32.11 TRINITY_DN14858_c0_g1_i1:10-519(-)